MSVHNSNKPLIPKMNFDPQRKVKQWCWCDQFPIRGSKQNARRQSNAAMAIKHLLRQIGFGQTSCTQRCRRKILQVWWDQRGQKLSKKKKKRKLSYFGFDSVSSSILLQLIMLTQTACSIKITCETKPVWPQVLHKLVHILSQLADSLEQAMNLLKVFSLWKDLHYNALSWRH